MKSIVKNTLLVKQISHGQVHEDYAVGKNAEFTLVYLVTGKSDVDLAPSVHLVGEGASTTILGLITGVGDAHIRVHTLQHHKAPKTTSNLLVKSVLRDSSTMLYEGSIRVAKTAQKTNAYQRNENLLLSEHSKATSSPALEILANDVRCTHGAVVKTLDENELWYLSSRGIDRESASDMIATGFLTSALSLINDDSERQLVQQKVLM